MTLQNSPTDWDKHFDDLIALDYLLNCLIMTLLLTISEFGELLLIPNT